MQTELLDSKGNKLEMEEAINRTIVTNNKYPTFQSGKISDGYHTFDELYEHRITLYMLLCKSAFHYMGSSTPVWISKKHSDGSEWGGWFLLGIYIEKGKQITYHLPISKWEECKEFSIIKEQAPEFDGHTSEDVLKRLKELI